MPKRKQKRKPNILEVRIEAVSKPKAMTPKQYLKALLRATVTGELPRGLEVDLHWRNPNTKHGKTKQWQVDDFTDALADSSSGFTGVVRRSIQRKMGEL